MLWLSDNVPCDLYQHLNIRKLQRSFLAVLIKQLDNRFWESNYIYQIGLLDLLSSLLEYQPSLLMIQISQWQNINFLNSTLTDIYFFVRDTNTSTNTKLASLIGVPLEACKAVLSAKMNENNDS
jgi:hypothetical protein